MTKVAVGDLVPDYQGDLSVGGTARVEAAGKVNVASWNSKCGHFFQPGNLKFDLLTRTRFT
jgi:hypothetical protein